MTKITATAINNNRKKPKLKELINVEFLFY